MYVLLLKQYHFLKIIIKSRELKINIATETLINYNVQDLKRIIVSFIFSPNKKILQIRITIWINNDKATDLTMRK